MADTVLSRAQRWMDTQMIEPFRQMIVGRKLYAKVFTPPPGTFNIDVNTMSDMGDAIISYLLPDANIMRDMVLVSTANQKIPIIAKGYEIPRSDYEAFKSKGIDLDMACALSAAAQIAEAEDDMLINGWKPDGTNYVVNGLYQSAGNTQGTADDFGTAGKATEKVSLAMAEMYNDNIFNVNYNMILNVVQYQQLVASRFTDGHREMPEVLEMINPIAGAPRGSIFPSSDIVAGTGLMTPVDTAGRFMDLVVAKDVTNVLGEDSKIPEISPIYGTMYEIVFPRIKGANAICTLTGI